MHTAAEAASGVGVGSFWMTCAFQWDFYQRFVLVAVLPVLVVLLCIVGVRIGYFRASWRTMCHVWTTASAMLVDPHERRMRCFLDASIVYCLYMAFPTVTEQLFHALKCTEVKLVADGGNVSISVLTADFRVSCLHNGAYDAVRGVGGGLVALYVLAPPVVLAWWIHRNREYLTDEMSMRRFGFLYRGYRLDAYPWWGCISLLSKVAVTAIVVFVGEELVQMVAALLVFTVLLFLQTTAKPFKTAMLNNLQVLAYATLVVTQFVPISISVIRTANLQERQQQLGEAAALPVSIGLIAVNGVVIIAYVVCAWKERGTAVAKTGRVLVTLRRRCCCCCSGAGRRGASLAARDACAALALIVAKARAVLRRQCCCCESGAAQEDSLDEELLRNGGSIGDAVILEECLEFKETNACEFGDQCRFMHASVHSLPPEEKST
jgi:hypothetical protein